MNHIRFTSGKVFVSGAMSYKAVNPKLREEFVEADRVVVDGCKLPKLKVHPIILSI